MQAVCFHQHGDPAEVLTVEDVPKPSPGPGEVLVRMLASPINPSDRLFIEGRYGQQAELPARPGFEGVGIVEASGGGALGKMLVGKRVAAVNRGGGNWAEYAVVSARRAIPLPKDLSLEQAATFVVNPMTAVAMTRKVLAVPRGKWLLQTAANSTLGRMVIRLGRHSGFRTINVVRSESLVEELKSSGADEVVKFDAATDDSDKLIETIRRLTGGGVRYAIDPVGGTVASALVRCLSDRGRLLSYGTLTDEPISIPPRHLIGPQASVEGFWLGKWMDEQSLPRKLLVIREVTKLIRAGVLASDVFGMCSLRGVPETISNLPPGKWLITVTPK